MREGLGKRWLTVGAMAVAALAWWRATAARERYRQLERGEIHPLSHCWTVIGGCRLYARVSTVAAGPGRIPVVLVHGFGVSSAYFVPAAERLASKFAVYAPDLPGHGQSDTPPEPLDIAAFADVLMTWMGAVGLERAALVGNSMGCQIVVEAAVRYPERVACLILIGPTADPAGRTLAEHARRLVLSAFYERLSLFGLIAADYARMGPRLIAELRFLLRDQIEKKLPLVKAPTMLVRGARDAIAPQRWLVEAVQRMGAQRLAVIPGWGHAVHYSAPALLVRAITPFLRQASLEAEQGDRTGSLSEIK